MVLLLVNKHSKYEWEKEKFNLSHDEIVKKYSKERANVDAILMSHDKQLEVRNMVKEFIPNTDMCFMSEAPKFLSNSNYDLVIVLGGDNSFTYVSHHIKDTPILGVNSDPDRSVGCLTKFSIKNADDVIDLATMIDFNEFDIEKWTRLEAFIDGEQIVSASNEYYFGERMANKMSRHVLVYDGKEYEQKCSGILIATGAGSTGWYGSAMSPVSCSSFSPTKNMGSFVVREPYSLGGSTFHYGKLNSGEEIILYSLNDDDGMVSVDSWEEFPFTRGSEARIHLGRPLNVIIPR